MLNESNRKRRGRLILPVGIAFALLLFVVTASAQEESTEGADEAASEDASASVEGEAEASWPQAEAEADVEGEAGLSTEDVPLEDEALPEEGAADDESPDKDVEEIVVTGSRIGRNNLDEYAHIEVVSSEDITLSGTATMDELLTKMPSVTLQGLNKNNNNGGQGLAFIDLRNLGTGRTLILINNRRFVPSGPGGSVDINAIPTSMIERVEVLLDGASAIYGSDAIGGVINFILKDDFDGFQVDVNGGISTYGDAGETQVSATMGGNHDHGNLTLNFTYYHREPLLQRDREWAEVPIAFEAYVTDDEGNPTDEVMQIIGSSNPPWGRAWAADGSSYAFKPDDGKSYVPWDNNYDAGHRYNYGEESFMIGGMDRFSITGLGTYELAEFAKAYMEGSYTHRESLTQMAPIPVGFGSNAWPNPLRVPLTNPYIPQDFYDDLSDANKAAGYIDMFKRFREIGNRQWESAANTFRLLLGVKGNILSDDYTWDVYGSYGKNRSLSTMHNAASLTRIQQTLDPDVCAQFANLGCQPFDGFGDNTLSQGVVDYVKTSEKDLTEWVLGQIGAAITAKPFDLPGGPFAAVVGGEARWEEGFYRPDFLVSGGDSGSNLGDPTEGGYNAQEVFAEVSLPLVKDIPGIHSLTLDLAGRFSAYDTFGSAFTYRAGMAYAPIADVKVRGVFSTAFRAPSINDLYGGSVEDFPSVQDPCQNHGAEGVDPVIKENCESQGVPGDFVPTGAGQIRTLRGANPELDAETARVFDVGLVFTPTFLPKSWQASLTVDYYNIVLEEAITQLDVQLMVDTCYKSQGLEHPFCDFVLARTSTHDISMLKATKFNIGLIETSGFDTTINLGIPVWKLRVLLGWNANYLLSFKEINTEEEEPEDDDPDVEQQLRDDKAEREEYAGEIGFNGGTYAHWRWNIQAGLSGTSWRWINKLRYIGEADRTDLNPETYPTPGVPSVMYWDTSASYLWKGLTIVVGCQNVLDKDPPFLPEGGQNANTQTYDFVGRYIYGRLGYRF